MKESQKNWIKKWWNSLSAFDRVGLMVTKEIDDKVNREINELIKTTPNDTEFGEKIRRMYN